jgi:four helix bundle protein
MATQQYGYRTLRVWHDSIDLAEQVYRLTANFPRHELFGMSSQLQRAAVSISLNVAEGRERDSTGDYLRFVSIAKGSLAEVETLLELARRLNYAEQSDIAALNERCSQIGRQLHALRASLKARQSSEPQ